MTAAKIENIIGATEFVCKINRRNLVINRHYNELNLIVEQ